MKITIEQDKCIGCGTCESLCPEFFKIKDDNKSHLKAGNQQGNKNELEVKDSGCAQEAKQGCPVQCIDIE